LVANPAPTNSAIPTTFHETQTHSAFGKIGSAALAVRIPKGKDRPVSTDEFGAEETERSTVGNML